MAPEEADMADEITEDAEIELDEAEMPVDEPEDDEELIDEIPVHGVATLEGKPTGDGRGFRAGGISFGKLPAPLGYEYTSTHGGMTSDVAVVGRIDEFWTVPSPSEGEGVFEVRYRGVIFPGKDFGARAIESIIDGSYTGLSVIVDAVEVDVEERRAEMRAQILHEQEQQGDEVIVNDDGDVVAERKPMSEEEIEDLLDTFIGDGKIETTWYRSARVRRFDMVPTGAFMEGYIALGSEFADELSEEALVAAAAALEDCGCGKARTIRASGAPTILVDLTGFTDDELEEYGALTTDAERDQYAQAHGVTVASTEFAPGTKDGPGWITHPVPTARIRRYWVRGQGAAKIKWGVPGDFNRCRMQLAKYVQNPDWLAGLCANMHKEAIGVWPGQEGGGSHSLVASAAPAPLFRIAASAALDPVDARLFENPRFTQASPITIDGDRITGYIAVWNTCHIGNPQGPNRCTYAPRSQTNYAWYRTGNMLTTEGMIPVGQLTMATGHAGEFLTAAEAAAHYDNTGTAIADIVCGEDLFGIWFSGRVRPDVDEEEKRAVMASGIVSGDWRFVGVGHELVGGLIVNVGGFPIPNPALVASASGVTAIIGEGMFVPEEQAVLASVGHSGPEAVIPLTHDLVAEIALTAAERVLFGLKREALLEELTPARARLQAHALRQARRRLATIEGGR